MTGVVESRSSRNSLTVSPITHGRCSATTIGISKQRANLTRVRMLATTVCRLGIIGTHFSWVSMITNAASSARNSAGIEVMSHSAGAHAQFESRLCVTDSRLACQRRVSARNFLELLSRQRPGILGTHQLEEKPFQTCE